MASPRELMEIGTKLVELCNQGRDTECLEMYSQDAVSAEAVPMPGQSNAEAVGLDAIRGKHEWWYGPRGARVQGSRPLCSWRQSLQRYFQYGYHQ